MGKPRKLPRKFSMPWGDGMVVEEVGVDTEWGNELVIQLLVYDQSGQESLRFCQYWEDGRFQRQPMILSDVNIPEMRDAIASPRIKQLLRQLLD